MKEMETLEKVCVHLPLITSGAMYSAVPHTWLILLGAPGVLLKPKSTCMYKNKTNLTVNVCV